MAKKIILKKRDSPEKIDLSSETATDGATITSLTTPARTPPKKTPPKKLSPIKTPTGKSALPTTPIIAPADDEMSYLGKSIADTYKDMQLREHIYKRPDTYAGSDKPHLEEMWVVNKFEDGEERMEHAKISYIEVLYKIFDEILVNAIDHHHRIETKEGVRKVTSISVKLNKEEGLISVENNGDGVDVVKHPTKGMYIPELIFGQLLTSANYEDTEKRTVGGRNGYGAKVTNIFSKEFTIETVDGNRKLYYKQTFRDNMTVKEEPVIEKYTKVPFTRITFKPDFERFGMKPDQPQGEGTWRLFERRVYDACACTGKGVNVTLNGTKLKYKCFEDYVNLYLGGKRENTRVYYSPNDRWEVVVAINNDGEFKQISFVNGINTVDGGKHVSHVVDNLTKAVIESLNSKAKKGDPLIKPQFVKDNLWVFIRSTIENPEFDSQVKRSLKSLVPSFGSRCDFSEEFIEKVTKLVGKRVQELAQFKAQKIFEQTTGGTKTGKVYHPKLDEGSEVGGPRSNQCTLVITEGDSAKAFVLSGWKALTNEQQKYWGVFPVRGKIINVKTATIEQKQSNEEIIMIKKILGLNEKTVDTSQLRYGHVIVLTDADHDGTHIKSLFINFIHTYWPSLLKIKGFIKGLKLPIIRASRVKEGVKLKKGRNPRDRDIIWKDFYSEGEFNEWMQREKPTLKPHGTWTLKYYKGLATYSTRDAEESFKKQETIDYVWNGEEDSDAISLVFTKDRADERKEWVSQVPLEEEGYEDGKIDESYSDLINKRLIHFSNYDNIRSIPNICDGLKPSQRKILFGVFKDRLLSKTKKVSIVASYVHSKTQYHHAQSSLEQTIINMAQNYVGATNINLLYPEGQFGTRVGAGNKLSVGEDAGAPRYIETRISDITPYIFRQEDNEILKYLVDEGQQIEPDHYLPIIPMSLVLGIDGMGTGFSTQIPCFNPVDVALNVKRALTGQDQSEMIPYYRGYRGTIVPHKKKTFYSVANYKITGPDKIFIDDLPVGKGSLSFKAYEAFLESLTDDGVKKNLKEKEKKKAGKEKAEKLEKAGKGTKKTDDSASTKSDKSVKFGGNSPIIKKYSVLRGTDIDRQIEITFHDGILEEQKKFMGPGENFLFERRMKLATSISTNNMTLWTADNTVKKFDSPNEIISSYIPIRLAGYVVRKDNQLKNMRTQLSEVSAKYRFVSGIINGDIQFQNVKKSEVISNLEKADPPFPKFGKEKKRKSTQEDESEDESEDELGGESGKSGKEAGPEGDYEYLLRMRIDSMTQERLDKLRREIDNLTKMIADLEGKTPEDIWNEELDKFLEELEYDTELWHEITGIKKHTTGEAPKPPPAKTSGGKIKKLVLAKKV
jgi:DNA topoisomerase II